MKTTVKIGLVVAIMGFLSFIFGGNADKNVDISALIQGGALVVDVRSPGEFSGGHIEGAVNIPYDVISREIAKHGADKDRAIILYCHSGARASAAKKALLQMGYAQVVNAASLRNMRKILDQ